MSFHSVMCSPPSSERYMLPSGTSLVVSSIAPTVRQIRFSELVPLHPIIQWMQLSM